MWPFQRRRKPAIPTYQVETTPTQLRIIRTHIAAQASELSTLGVQLGQLGAKLDQVLTRRSDGGRA